MGTLFVVATPIGNLEDLSPRATRILSDVSLIAAEDTRHTGRMLARLGIKTPMMSYHAFNERARLSRLLAALDAGDVALVSDAGTPAIADPGRELVDAAFTAGHTVSPIPGPSAVTAAAAVSGIIDGPFLSIGFLPRKGPARRRAIALAATTGIPVILFEAPTRLVSTLRDLASALGDRPATVARELTKLHEEIRRDSLGRLASTFEQSDVRGEVVIVVAGTEPQSPDGDTENEAAVVVAALLSSGLKPSEAAREAARITGQPRSDMYDLARRLGADR